MKRRILSIVAVVLVVAMLSVVLVACFGADSYVSKLHKEGYYVDTETDEDVLNYDYKDDDDWDYGEVVWTLDAVDDIEDSEEYISIISFKDKKDAEDYFDDKSDELEDLGMDDDFKILIKGKDVIQGTKKAVKIFE